MCVLPISCRFWRRRFARSAATGECVSSASKHPAPIAAWSACFSACSLFHWLVGFYLGGASGEDLSRWQIIDALFCCVCACLYSVASLLFPLLHFLPRFCFASVNGDVMYDVFAPCFCHFLNSSSSITPSLSSCVAVTGCSRTETKIQWKLSGLKTSRAA